jgi:hypothetical protein
MLIGRANHPPPDDDVFITGLCAGIVIMVPAFLACFITGSTSPLLPVIHQPNGRLRVPAEPETRSVVRMH